MCSTSRYDDARQTTRDAPLLKAGGIAGAYRRVKVKREIRGDVKWKQRRLK